MFGSIYKKIVTDFSKITLLLISILVVYSLYQSKNFNLDASSDALLLEGDPDLKYLREINETYGSKDFLVLTYTGDITNNVFKTIFINPVPCNSICNLGNCICCSNYWNGIHWSLNIYKYAFFNWWCNSFTFCLKRTLQN